MKNGLGGDALASGLILTAQSNKRKNRGGLKEMLKITCLLLSVDCREHSVRSRLKILIVSFELKDIHA
jgi:hypothetical protein